MLLCAAFEKRRQKREFRAQPHCCAENPDRSWNLPHQPHHSMFGANSSPKRAEKVTSKVRSSVPDCMKMRTCKPCSRCGGTRRPCDIDGCSLSRARRVFSCRDGCSASRRVFSVATGVLCRDGRSLSRRVLSGATGVLWSRRVFSGARRGLTYYATKVGKLCQKKKNTSRARFLLRHLLASRARSSLRKYLPSPKTC